MILASLVAAIAAFGTLGLQAWHRRHDRSAIALLYGASVTSLALSAFLAFAASPLGI